MSPWALCLSVGPQQPSLPARAHPPRQPHQLHPPTHPPTHPHHDRRAAPAAGGAGSSRQREEGAQGCAEAGDEARARHPARDGAQVEADPLRHRRAGRLQVALLRHVSACLRWWCGFECC